MRKLLIAGLVLACAAGMAAPCAAVAQEAGDQVSPDMAAIQRQLFRGHAVLAVRIQRLVGMGLLCRLLSDEDALLIQNNANADADYERSRLPEKDREWAEVYTQGLQDGAFRAADLSQEIGPEVCQKFAAPGGPLVKILTWTDRPQEIAPGIRASPRTLP
ncbi:hypothetical protein [Brevundimonas sp.]|uniref:hypothetical protein n=1 Tax=Brevundimonas sp. TaxID=1871086 RepID=UPI0025BC5062|nr:hypothetical protein [Brevundimonas sp.]